MEVRIRIARIDAHPGSRRRHELTQPTRSNGRDGPRIPGRFNGHKRNDQPRIQTPGIGLADDALREPVGLARRKPTIEATQRRRVSRRKTLRPGWRHKREQKTKKQKAPPHNSDSAPLLLPHHRRASVRRRPGRSQLGWSQILKFWRSSLIRDSSSERTCLCSRSRCSSGSRWYTR